MRLRYLELTDYLAIAAEVTGLSVDTVVKVVQVHLANSALDAPSASFGGQELYPDFVDKAAVLWSASPRTTRSPTGTSAPPGSRFGCSSRSTAGGGTPYPSVDDAEAAVLRIASSGWVEQDTAEWLRGHLRSPLTP